MSNHSWVFLCRNGSRVIQDRRIINQEDFEARVFKKTIFRTVTETLSPVADLGQDKKEENGTASNGKKAEDEEKYDTLELRNR